MSQNYFFVHGEKNEPKDRKRRTGKKPDKHAGMSGEERERVKNEKKKRNSQSLEFSGLMLQIKSAEEEKEEWDCFYCFQPLASPRDLGENYFPYYVNCM